MVDVVLVSASAAPGGAERALVNLVRQLPGIGISAVAYVLEPGPLVDMLNEAGCPTSVINAGRTRHLHHTAASVARLRQELIDRPGAIVLSNQSKSHIYGGIAATLSHHRALWWQHEIPHRSTIELVAARVPTDAILCTSTEALNAQRRLTPHVALHHIPPGTDIADVRAAAGKGAAVRAQLGWKDMEIIGTIGRLQPWKGQVTFLRAAANLIGVRSNARFLIVGGAILGWERDYPATLRRLAQDLGISDKVAFVGHQSDVYHWIDACDVVVHTSTDEPFGLVIVEAMALGKPVVVTKGPGPCQIVEQGVSGLIVPPAAPQELADAINGLLMDTSRATTMARHATTKSETFGADQIAAQIAQIIREMKASSDRYCRSAPYLPDAAMAPSGAHRIADHLVDRTTTRAVIDAGPGLGAFSSRLLAAGLHPIAVGDDRTRFQLGETVPFVLANLDNGLPFGDESVGGVVAIEVIEHVEAPLRFVREVHRCLIPGGWLLVTTPNVFSIASKVSMVFRNYPIYFGDFEYQTNGHISPTSLTELRRIAERLSMKVDAVTYSDGKLPIPKLRHWKPFANLRPGNRHLGESLIVRLRKADSVATPSRAALEGDDR